MCNCVKPGLTEDQPANNFVEVNEEDCLSDDGEKMNMLPHPTRRPPEPEDEEAKVEEEEENSDDGQKFHMAEMKAKVEEEEENSDDDQKFHMLPHPTMQPPEPWLVVYDLFKRALHCWNPTEGTSSWNPPVGCNPVSSRYLPYAAPQKGTNISMGSAFVTAPSSTRNRR